MAKRFYIITGNSNPVFVSDEESGQAYAFASMAEARKCAKDQILCKAYGYVVLEWTPSSQSLHAFIGSLTGPTR